MKLKLEENVKNVDFIPMVPSKGYIHPTSVKSGGVFEVSDEIGYALLSEHSKILKEVKRSPQTKDVKSEAVTNAVVAG